MMAIQNAHGEDSEETVRMTLSVVAAHIIKTYVYICFFASLHSVHVQYHCYNQMRIYDVKSFKFYFKVLIWCMSECHVD